MSNYYDTERPKHGRSQDNSPLSGNFPFSSNLPFNGNPMSYSRHTPSCAEYLDNALDALFCNRFKGLFKPSTFTLYTLFNKTAQDDTTIKNLPSCKNGLIEFSENGNSKFASLCNLTGFSFLLNTSSGDLGDLTKAIKDWLSTCDYPHCSSCNAAKAERLRNSLSHVTLQVAETIGLLTDVAVLEVAENAVWVADKVSYTPHVSDDQSSSDKPPCPPPGPPPCPPPHHHKIRIYVICLDNIEFIS